MTTINGRLGTVGTVTDNTWSITSPVSLTFTYGDIGWIPLVGDWNGDGIEGIGAYDPVTKTFYLKNTIGAGYADVMCQYGTSGDTPLSWYDSAHNRDGIGIIRPSQNLAYLDRDLTCGIGEIGLSPTKLNCGSAGVVTQCTLNIGTCPISSASILSPACINQGTTGNIAATLINVGTPNYTYNLYVDYDPIPVDTYGPTTDTSHIFNHVFNESVGSHAIGIGIMDSCGIIAYSGYPAVNVLQPQIAQAGFGTTGMIIVAGLVIGAIYMATRKRK